MDATTILLQLVLGNWANLQLQVSHVTKNQLHKTVAKWQIFSSGCNRNTCPINRWYEPNVEIAESCRMKSEDYPPLIENQATYAQLSALKVGPISMFFSTKGSRKVQKEETHDVYL